VFLIVTTTIDDLAAADELVRSAVGGRLAACAQVTGPIQSTYWWQGTVETTDEWRITFKTTDAAAPLLAKHIREHHPYVTPEVIATVVDERGSNPAYLQWVNESLAA
jgi:periplasmic divalent cation tolerance protein